MSEKDRILHGVVESFKQALQDTKPSLDNHANLMYEMLSVTFDSGGKHFESEVRRLRNTSYELMTAIQVLVDDLCYRTDSYGDPLFKRLPMPLQDRLEKLMRETKIDV